MSDRPEPAARVPRSFRTRSIAAFSAAVGMGAVLALAAAASLRSASVEMDHLVSVEADTLVAVQRLNMLSERIGRTGRIYALTQNDRFRGELMEARQEFDQELARIQPPGSNGGAQRLLARVRQVSDVHEDAVDRIIALRNPDADEVTDWFSRDVQPLRDELVGLLEQLIHVHEQDLARAHQATTDRTSRLVLLLVLAGVAILLASALLARALGRTLSKLTRNQQELQELTTRLTRANQDLEAFAGRVAHDLGNLLAPVTLTAKRIENRADAPEDVRRYAHRIGETALRSRSLIADLLAFARAGEVADPDASARVLTVAREAEADLDELRVRVDAELRLDIDPGVHVRCGAVFLHMLLVNLIGNALKFVEGRSQRRVTLRAHRKGATCVLIVEDTGPGMTAETRAHVFRPFYRAADTHVPGTGLGMATVLRIVEAHQGQIEVWSELDQGTRISVRLPAAQAPATREVVGEPEIGSVGPGRFA